MNCIIVTKKPKVACLWMVSVKACLSTFEVLKIVQVMFCCPLYQLGMLARPCNPATGELVLWTVDEWESLVAVVYVDPASAPTLGSAWSHCGNTL